jgi:hypothetical protein
VLTFKGPLTPEQASVFAYLGLMFALLVTGVAIWGVDDKVPVVVLFLGSFAIAAPISRVLLRHWRRKALRRSGGPESQGTSELR